ncbi:ribonuclease H-like domain-containing protein [Candidatus Microgenomates bacterium]|nr:ribonuclease H-like domain-containing protein [Candidatus Microgenomates bacterium]
MPKLAFDIETVGSEWDKLSAPLQESIVRSLKKSTEVEEEYLLKLEEAKVDLGFSPLTGEIVALGCFDVEKGTGTVFFQSPGKLPTEFIDNGITYKPMEEKKILESFWELARGYDEFITFNGYYFDAPYMMLRSAMLGVRPSKNLVEGRYPYQQKTCKHTDLFDQFSFYGAFKRKGMGLDGLSSAFGVKSPKEEGMDGSQVGAMFAAGEYEKIARYNAEDIRATAELYRRWEKYLRF